MDEDSAPYATLTQQGRQRQREQEKRSLSEPVPLPCGPSPAPSAVARWGNRKDVCGGLRWCLVESWSRSNPTKLGACAKLTLQSTGSSPSYGRTPTHATSCHHLHSLLPSGTWQIFYRILTSFIFPSTLSLYSLHTLVPFLFQHSNPVVGEQCLWKSQASGGSVERVPRFARESGGGQGRSGRIHTGTATSARRAAEAFSIFCQKFFLIKFSQKNL